MLIILVLAIAATVLGVPALRLLDRTATEPRSEPVTARSHAAAPTGPSARAYASGGAAPLPSAGPSATAQPLAGVSVSVGSAHPVEIIAYGPWQCADDYTWDLGHPVLAKPCHSTGTGIKLVGRMTGLPGVQTDVTVTLLDAQTGDVVSGPFECDGLMFTDFAPAHDCGPFEVNLPHGRRLVVSESWHYTGRSVLPSGTVKGPEFNW